MGTDAMRKGHVTLVGAGPGAADLLTIRGANALSTAEVVLFDHLVDRAMLAHVPSSAELVFVGKIPDGPRVPQHRINAMLVEHAQAGKRVVRLKGGDPFVFGRGGEEALALSNAEIAFDVVPGISSCVAAPGLAGIPVTHRGVARNFTVITATDSGRVLNAATTDRWARLASVDGTLVFLMGVRRLQSIADAMLAGGRPADEPIAIVERASTASQRVIHGTLETIVAKAATHSVASPATIVVGDVVAVSAQIAKQIVGHEPLSTSLSTTAERGGRHVSL